MLRILIVDDAYLIRKSLRKTLESLQTEVLVAGEAANGSEALKWLECNYADLCITDIKMPVMDGLELISHFHPAYPWMDSLIISSYDDFEFARKSLQLRTSDYILKPIDNTLVVEAIRNVMINQKVKREKEAARILMDHLPHHRKLVEEWIETLHATREQPLPKLISDTLAVLQDWKTENHYLLPQLAMNWIKVVAEELNVSASFAEGALKGRQQIGYSPVMAKEVNESFIREAEETLFKGTEQLVKEIAAKKENQEIKVIENIKIYVKNHLGGDIKLQELAEHVALNKTYMCTVFKQETNMTVWNYIVLERMGMARDRLLNTTDKIYEIANSVGYEDVNYFSTLFRKHFGMSPLDYRKKALR